MISYVSKSIRLTRYHMILVVIIVAVIVYFLLRYFSMIQANIERFAFNNNMQLIERMLNIQQIIAAKKKNICDVLDNKRLFQQTIGKSLEMTNVSDAPNNLLQKWEYDAKKHILTYHVRSKRYFRSKQGQKIVIKFACKNNRITFTTSAYKWCDNIGLFGCKKW